MTKQPARRRASVIVIESTLTRSMYIRILLLLGVRSWVFLLLTAVLVYLVWLSSNSGDYSFLLIYASVFVVIYFGAIVFSVFARGNRRAFSPVKYQFDVSGITKETAATSQVVKWTTLTRWRKIGGCYLIYMSKRSFFVIPRVKIPEGQVGSFENLLAQNIVPRRARFGRR